MGKIESKTITRNVLVYATVPQDFPQRERLERRSHALVELGGELHPHQTDSVKKSREGLHTEQDGSGKRGETGPAYKEEGGVVRLESHLEDLLVDNVGQLGVRKRKRPKTQVGRGVGKRTEAELDNVDQVHDENFEDVEFWSATKLDALADRLEEE